MAGHSHWARIKRAKAVTDSRRGKHWSKLSRAIIVAARNGGDPDANLALRYAIDAARGANMPKDTIERAIKKGSGAGGETNYEEVVYEGYGPGGAAVMCTGLTDNRTRTAAEIRKVFELNGGNFGASNSVAWMFTQRGVFRIPNSSTDEDTLTNVALECGADDVKSDGDSFELSCEPAAFEAVKKALAAAKITPESAEVEMVPNTSVALSGEKAEQMMELVDALEENDDIQKVYSNFDVSEADAAKLGG